MTTFRVGSSGIHLVTDHGAGPTYPAWQAGSKVTISKAVGGRTYTMIAGIPPSEAVSPSINCPQISSFTSFDGVSTIQWCHSISAGVGWGTEIYVLDNTAENNRHDLNAVESGRLGDTPPLDAATKALAQGLSDASGENMIRIYNPCFWLAPGQQTIPGFPAKNTREVSGWVCRVDYTWGLAGNDNIIQMLLTVEMPIDATIQNETQLSVVPFFHYSPNYNAGGIYANQPFTTQEWVNFTTGATRAYVGPPAADTSTTEVLMNHTADQTCAVAVVYGAGALGSAGTPPTGYRGLNGGPPNYVNSYGFCVKEYPLGVPAGTIVIPMALCFGTYADLIGGSGVIVTANANLAAASYPAA